MDTFWRHAKYRPSTAGGGSLPIDSLARCQPTNPRSLPTRRLPRAGRASTSWRSSHLDTQWRWTVRETAADFPAAHGARQRRPLPALPPLSAEFRGRLPLPPARRVPPGALRDACGRRVAEGRWFPSGAAWEAFDTNLPAPESIVRQILYGTRYLERAVGKAGRDLFLPDCFGFSQALPTLAAHCGIVGFSSQKLRRGAEMRSAFGVPFPFGLWVGPDGSTLPAVLDPGEYGAQAASDLATDPDWIARFAALAADRRPDRLMTYQGLGDKGGAIAPRDDRLARAGARPAAARSKSGCADSEQIFRRARRRRSARACRSTTASSSCGCMPPAATARAPSSSAGTARPSSSPHAAERAAAIAQLLGVRTADRARLREAWLRILAHEMHDDLTGTSLVEAYRYSAARSRALHRTSSARSSRRPSARSRRPSTPRPRRTPLVVFNALGWERTDLVEIELPDAMLSSTASPSSTLEARGALAVATGGEARLEAASSGRSSFTELFAFRPAQRPPTPTDCSGSELSRRRELPRERAPAGRDRRQRRHRPDLRQADGRELLAAPVGLEILDNFSDRFPSWEIRCEDTSRPARTRVAGPVRTLAVERGAARVALTLERTAEGSRFRQTISLAAGEAGDHVVLDTTIDWRTDAALLKMRFPLATPAEQALFDQGVGIARRPVAIGAALRSAGAPLGGAARRARRNRSRRRHRQRLQVRLGPSQRRHPAPDAPAHAAHRPALPLSGEAGLRTSPRARGDRADPRRRLARRHRALRRTRQPATAAVPGAACTAARAASAGKPRQPFLPGARPERSRRSGAEAGRGWRRDRSAPTRDHRHTSRGRAANPPADRAPARQSTAASGRSNPQRCRRIRRERLR